MMTERRKTRRQNYELPLNIVRVGSHETDWFERTQNISSNGGVCFHSLRSVTAGEKVQYYVTLSKMGSAHVRIICWGRVVRCRPLETGPDGTLEIAMTMDRYRFCSPGVSGIDPKALSESNAALALTAA